MNESTRHFACDRWILIAALFVLLWPLTGCGKKGPPMAPVAGTVTFEGKPLSSGTITFVPQPSGPYAYGEIVDGKYRLRTPNEGDGAVLGSHKIMVSAVDVPDPNFPVAVPLIPFEYSSYETSGLDAEVQGGKENVIDFDLKKKLEKKRRR